MAAAQITADRLRAARVDEYEARVRAEGAALFVNSDDRDDPIEMLLMCMGCVPVTDGGGLPIDDREMLLAPLGTCLEDQSEPSTRGVTYFAASYVSSHTLLGLISVAYMA